MADITKEQAIECIKNRMCWGRLVGNTKPIFDEVWQAGVMAIEALKERKQGEWIKVDESEFGTVWKCSECGRIVVTHCIDNAQLSDYPYCHCGAEMRGSENE